MLQHAQAARLKAFLAFTTDASFLPMLKGKTALEAWKNLSSLVPKGDAVTLSLHLLCQRSTRQRPPPTTSQTAGSAMHSSSPPMLSTTSPPLSRSYPTSCPASRKQCMPSSHAPSLRTWQRPRTLMKLPTSSAPLSSSCCTASPMLAPRAPIVSRPIKAAEINRFASGAGPTSPQLPITSA